MNVKVGETNIEASSTALKLAAQAIMEKIVELQPTLTREREASGKKGLIERELSDLVQLFTEESKK